MSDAEQGASRGYHEAVLPEAANRAGRLWWYWAPVAAHAGLIFYLSSQSIPPKPALWWLDVLGDKVVHALEFGLLGLLCYRAFRFAAWPKAARSALLLAVLAATGYGVTDEIHQAFVPFRQPSPWDVLADWAGASLVSWLWRRFIEP